MATSSLLLSLVREGIRLARDCQFCWIESCGPGRHPIIIRCTLVEIRMISTSFAFFASFQVTVTLGALFAHSTQASYIFL